MTYVKSRTLQRIPFKTIIMTFVSTLLRTFGRCKNRSEKYLFWKLGQINYICCDIKYMETNKGSSTEMICMGSKRMNYPLTPYIYIYDSDNNIIAIIMVNIFTIFFIPFNWFWTCDHVLCHACIIIVRVRFVLSHEETELRSSISL